MKPISIVLLIVGVILLSYGVTASDSIGSSFSRFFTGQPTDRTIWLLVAGAVAAILGLTGLLRGAKVS
jgi:amino acid permease